jgi:hypothetical protein
VPVDHQRELAGRLRAVERDRDQARHRLVAVGEPEVARERKRVALRGRAGESRAALLRERLGRARVIRVGDDDECDAAERVQVLAIVRRERQWVDRDVAAHAHPEHRVEVEVARLVEHRPAEEIRPVQSLQGLLG